MVRPRPNDVTPRWFVAAACAVPRLLYLVWSGPAPANTYHIGLAGRLLQTGDLATGDLPTTAFDPLYPAFLAAARWVSGDHLALVAIFQIGVCCAGAVLLYELTASLTGRRGAALASALLLAGYPYLIRQSVAWMEISLLATLLLGSLLAFDRLDRAPRAGRAMTCGLLLGLTVLTRTMTAPICAVAIILLVARRQWASAGTVAFACAALIAPFAIRNYRIDGSIVPTRIGENLFVGNNEYADRFIPRYDLDLLPDYGEAVARARLGLAPGAPLADRAIDAAMTDAALAFMREHPWRTLRLKVLNLLYFFDVRLVPFEPAGAGTTVKLDAAGGVLVEHARQRPRLASLAHSVAYGVVLGGAVAGWVLRRTVRRRDALPAAVVAVFAITSMIYFPTTRMRAPIDPILMVYAGVGVAAALERLRGAAPRSAFSAC